MFYNKKKVLLNLILILLLKLSFLIFFFTSWIVNFFGDYVGYQEIIFYFNAGYNSFKIIPNDIIYSFLKNVVLKSVIFTLIFFFIFKLSIQKNFLINLIDKIVQFKNAIKISIIGILFIFSINYFIHKFNFYELIFNYSENKINIVKNFKDPHHIKFNNPKKLKNLILIFYESAEKNYPDFSLTTALNGSFTEYLDQEDVHMSLRNIKGYEIENFVQAQSLEWSMAGMSAAQCGIPFYDSSRSINKETSLSYQPLCIGDILKKYGYEQFFFTGVEKNFQNQDQFYLSHSFDQVFGRSDFVLKKIKDNFFNSWGKGLHDDILFEQALNKIKELNDSEKKFNIVIKTSDTHFPYRYSSPNCKNEKKFDNNFDEHFYLNLRESFKCSSQFIAKFIKKLKKEDFFQDTLIVVSGDHLISVNDKTSKYLNVDNYNKDPLINRRIFFKVINSTNTPTRNLMSHYDIAPTILNDLQILNSNQYKFGLGLSLYSNYKPQLYFDEYIQLIRSQNLSLIFSKFLRKKKLN